MVPSSDTGASHQTHLARQEFVAELGQQALETDDIETLLSDACAGVRELLDAAYCTVFESHPGELLLRQGNGLDESLLGSQTVPVDSHAGYTFRSGEGVVVDDIRADDRFSSSDLLASCDIASGIAVVVGPADEPWGVLGAYTTTTAAFTDEDTVVLRAVANVLGSALQRLEAERRLDTETALKDRIVETCPVGIGVIDGTGTIQFVNRRAEDILGRSREELTTYTHDDPRWGLADVEGTTLEAGETPFERVMRTGERLSGTTVSLLRPDGQRIWLSINGAPLDAGETRSRGAVFTFTDVTEQRRIEAEFEEMLGRVSDAFIAVDEELRFVHVNERAEELLQHSEDELLGANLWEMFPEAAEKPVIRESIQTALESQEPTSVELYYDPLELWVEANLYPSETGVSVYFRDVTERKQQAGRFQAFIEHSTDIITVLDERGVYQYQSPSGEQVLGYDVGELLGENAFDLVHPDDRQELLETFSEAVANPSITPVVEYRFQHRDGSWRWMESVGNNQLENPAVNGVVVNSRDITERKEREQELARFKRAVEASGHAIYMTDVDGEITYVNPAFEDVTGYSAEEAIGDEPDILQSGEHDDAYYRTLWETVLGGEVWEEEITDRRADGTLYHAEQTIAPVTDEYGDIDRFVAVQRDVTGRKEREQALREERDLVQRIIATTPVGVVTLGTDGSFDRVNDRAEEIVGYTADDFDDIGEALDALESVTPAGDPHPVDEHPVNRVLSRGETVHDIEIGITRSDGERRWLSVSGTPLRVDGTLTGAVITFADSTERREAVNTLRERERQLSTVMSNIPGMVYRCRNEPGWPMEFVSDGCRELTDYDPEVFERDEARFGENIIVEADRTHVREQVQESVDDNEPFTVTYRIETADGELRWVRESGRGIDADDGAFGLLEGVIIDITEQKEFEQELHRRRAELERLNRINALVQEIIQKLIQEPSRTEIEQQVCDHLVDSDLYEAAWVGEHSVTHEGITLDAWAGIEEDATTAITESCTGCDDARGFIGRTLETRELQAVQSVETGTAVDDCYRQLQGYGIESALAVPVQYRNTLYGTLVIGAAQSNAFDERHQHILGEFGETLGFAITAAERKEALLTDERVELEIRVREPDHFFFSATADIGTTLTVQGLVTHSEEHYLVYATTPNGPTETILSRATDSGDIEHARLVERYEDESLLEFVSTTPAVITTLAEYGGTVTTATAENNGATLTVVLPPSANVRTVVDAFQSSYPDSDVLAKRTADQPAQSPRGARTAVLDRLTDKQREALYAAYFSGYYERPRNSSGSELAGAMGVSPSTFHQHRQAGLRKLLATVFDERYER